MEVLKNRPGSERGSIASRNGNFFLTFSLVLLAEVITFPLDIPYTTYGHSEKKAELLLAQADR